MVTQVLKAVSDGDPRAGSQLLPLVYEELRVLARSRLASVPRRGGDNTLQPTALVHEAYLRLVKAEDPSWNSRGHFFAAAAQAMRQILVDQARRKAAVKHGGAGQRVNVEIDELPIQQPREDMIALDAALVQLEAADERKARIVMLRYFAGLTAEQTALALGISEPTVNREWKIARVLLKLQIESTQEG
ncbi:MAG: sigma-70 family RNA polymerase sigma factor [Pyrinomonadaceae bacterium]|nr:sigma-70 family RNA polymerase sigma factor [Phycisphaerales bacterium]